MRNLVIAACVAASFNGYAQTPPDCAKVTAATCALHRDLGKGINLGNMLEAPNEGDWGVRLDPAYIDLVSERFKTVRLPVRWSNHASPDAAAKIDPFFLKRVTNAVDALLAKGVYVIVNVHHYNQIFGDALHPREEAVSPDVVEARLFSIWAQVADHFKDRSPKLVFELLNEPHGKLDAKAWNDMAPSLLAVVRKTNPARVVMVGPVSWNSARGLASFKVPADPNLIIAVHNYDPFTFTHQGIKHLPQKLPAGVTCCDDAQKAEVSRSIRVAKQWSEQSGYPIHLGEFGSFQAGDMASRVNYTRFVRSELERQGVPWAYWEFASTFGLYSPATKRWNQDLLGALFN